MANLELPDEMRDGVREVWHRYLDVLNPVRPALYAYCRRLTGNVWDAEDLVQDTLLRGFGFLGRIHQEIRNPRAYLLRTATNVWIDTLRRRGTEARILAEQEAPGNSQTATPGALRDAGAALLQHLAPRERAAVVLKDVCDLSLEETAEVLGTTVGAVKAALHRGRGRLRDADEDATPSRPTPSVALVDGFVELFNKRDMQGLLALMLENGCADNVGGGGIHHGGDEEYGYRAWFRGAILGHPEWPAIFQYEADRVERGELAGEPIVLILRTRGGKEALEVVVRLEEQEGRIARLRSYGFCPEVVREVGAELGLPVRTGIYRAPTPAAGKRYEKPADGASG